MNNLRGVYGVTEEGLAGDAPDRSRDRRFRAPAKIAPQGRQSEMEVLPAHEAETINFRKSLNELRYYEEADQSGRPSRF